jgi:hypothetical protein
MRYDPEANIILWEIAQGPISHTREIGSFLIHVSSSEKPVLIEILDASKFIGQIDRIKNVGEIKDIKKMVPEVG